MDPGLLTKLQKGRMLGRDGEMLGRENTNKGEDRRDPIIKLAYFQFKFYSNYLVPMESNGLFPFSGALCKYVHC